MHFKWNHSHCLHIKLLSISRVRVHTHPKFLSGCQNFKEKYKLLSTIKDKISWSAWRKFILTTYSSHYLTTFVLSSRNGISSTWIPSSSEVCYTDLLSHGKCILLAMNERKFWYHWCTILTQKIVIVFCGTAIKINNKHNYQNWDFFWTLSSVYV